MKNHENFTRGINIENGITQKKYNPFQFIENALDDIEKCVEDNKQTILDAKKNIQEGINKGIKYSI